MRTNSTSQTVTQRKPFYSVFSSFALFVCTVASLVLSNHSFAQEGNCTTSNCVSSDIKVLSVKLVQKTATGYVDLPKSCSSADAVYNVSLKVKFDVTSQTRYGFLITGTIYINDQPQPKIAQCTEKTLQQGPDSIYVDTYITGAPILWKCGEKIELKSTYTAWNSSVTSLPKNPSICSYYDKQTGLVSANACKAISPKCKYYGPNESFLIIAPLSASFTQKSATCGTNALYKTYTFTATATGGYLLPQGGAYTYKWYINDVLQSSTTNELTYTPTSSSNFTVKLQVTDQDNPATTVTYPDPGSPYSVTPEVCCSTPEISGNPTSDEKCAGGSISFTATATGTPTPTVQWQEKVGSGSFTNISNGTVNGVTYSGATGTTLTITGLTASMSGNQYRAVFTTNSACPTANSTPATVTVDPATVGGSAAAALSPICSGTGTSITLSGNTGAIQKWQKSTDGGATWTDIVSTANPLSTGNLTATTQFRAVVKSGTCDAQNSSPATVTVDPATVGGSAAAALSPICSGTGTSITLSGNTGAIQKWQKSTDGGATWTDIVSTANPLSTGNLTATTQFRAVVKSGTCDAQNSSPATVTVDPATVGGSAAAALSPICSGTGTSITLSGNTGAIQKWQKSTDGGATWTDIVSTANPLSTGNLTATTQFRAVVKSGTCDAQNSSPATVTVDPATVGGSAAAALSPICSGTGTSITLSGNTGAIQKWQKSTDGGATWTDIVSTANPLSTGNLTATTQFRAVVKSGTCDAQNSSPATVTVGSIPTKPAFTITQPTLCNDKGSITICNSISGFDYTVAGVTKHGTGSSLTFGDLVAGSNPKLTVVNTTGGCSDNTEYSCGDAVESCPPQGMITQQSRVTSQDITLNSESKTSVLAAPNPFNDRIRFTLKANISGQGTLELYNMLGQKMKTVFSGYVKANEAQTIEYAVPFSQRANMIYLFRVGTEHTTGKLIGLKQ